MLTMALVGRYVTALARAGSLRNYSLRFLGPSRVGDEITCGGRIVRTFEQDDALCAQIELQVTRKGGEQLASGAAILQLVR